MVIEISRLLTSGRIQEMDRLGLKGEPAATTTYSVDGIYKLDP